MRRSSVDGSPPRPRRPDVRRCDGPGAVRWRRSAGRGSEPLLRRRRAPSLLRPHRRRPARLDHPATPRLSTLDLRRLTGPPQRVAGAPVERAPRLWWHRRVARCPSGCATPRSTWCSAARCVGCDRPGRLLCRGCAAGLPAAARPAWPSPVAAGLVTPWAAAAYDGTVRALVIGHKEHRLLALREPLARPAGRAVAAGRRGAATGPVRAGAGAVPPGRVRARGHDPTARDRRAGGAPPARAGGSRRPACARCCARAPACVDQAGLDAAARAANLAGSMRCPRPGAAPAGPAPAAGRRWWSATTCSPPARPPARRSGRSRRSGCGWLASRPSRRPGGGCAAGVRRQDQRFSGLGLSSVAADRLASLYGVRPGPWLRRSGAPGPERHGRQADASRRRNGPRKARRSRARPRRQPITVRLRGKSCLAARRQTRRPGEKGSSGREAANPSAGGCGVEDQVGRAGSIHAEHGPPARPRPADRSRSQHQRSEVHMDVVVTGRHCELSDRFRSHVAEKLDPAREARPPHHARPGGGRERAQPAPGRPCRAGRADRVLQGPGDPGRGRRRGQDGRPRPRARQDGRPDAPRRRPPPRAPRPAHPGLGRPRRSPTSRPERARRPRTTTSVTERQVGPITVTGDGPLVVREKTHPATPDDARPGALRDGAGRPRLLPVRRQGDRAAVGGLPPPRLRLRRHLARPRS